MAVGDANLQLLLRQEMQQMSKNSKGYFMTEEDVSSLCLMTNTEWEKLALVQDVKVNNNPSITKNVMGES